VFLDEGSHASEIFKLACISGAASLEKRIENLVGRGWPKEVAIKKLDASDHERGAFINMPLGWIGMTWVSSILCSTWTI